MSKFSDKEVHNIQSDSIKMNEELLKLKEMQRQKTKEKSMHRLGFNPKDVKKPEEVEIEPFVFNDK